MKAAERKMTLYSLALPILAELILRNLMGTANVFLLSRYSDNAVAAVGVANQIMNVANIAFTMIASGASVFINQYLGGEDRQNAGFIASNSIGLMAFFGILASAAMAFFAPAFTTLLGLEPELVADAVTYLRITGGTSVLIGLSSMLSAIFRCHGNAKAPMLVVLINNIINIAGTALVVFRPIEIPLTGVFGVSCVRAFSELAGVVILIVLLMRADFGIDLHAVLHIDLKNLGKIMKLGIMTGMEGISYTLGQVVTTGFLTSFGAAALSAKVYVQSIGYYAYVVGLSIGHATQILSGHRIGADEEEQAFSIVKRAYPKVLVCNLTFGFAIYLFSTPLMHLFTQDPQIIAIAKPLLLVDVLINAARALNHSFNYGLRSARYVFYPMIIAVASIWVLNVAGGYVFSTVFSLGALGLWIAQACDEWVRGLSVMTLWMRRKWMRRTAATSPETH